VASNNDAAMASRRPGARESGGSEMTGFELVRIITQTKRIQMELDAFNPDGSVKPRIIGTLDKPIVAPPADRRAARRGGPNLTTAGRPKLPLSYLRKSHPSAWNNHQKSTIPQETKHDQSVEIPKKSPDMNLVMPYDENLEFNTYDTISVWKSLKNHPMTIW